ncbi:hypothetical protein F4801DRAFT_574870 [Xylaria longipes]|nr:hypothetical protein F4801DRAFT_574870 [Xylaria longipes]
MSVAVTATDVLAWEHIQVVQYLEKNTDADGGFDTGISNLVGVRELPKSEKIKLGEKLNSAILQLQNPTASQPLQLDELCKRLTHIADEQNGPSDYEPSRPRPRFKTPSPTPPPTGSRVADHEAACYHELIRDGGRPVCSIEELSYICAEPRARYKAILSWLSDDVDSTVGKSELKSVFSSQFTRWWEFRKSQVENRGIGNDEEMFSAFVVAISNEWHMNTRLISSASFPETAQRMWHYMYITPQLVDGRGFSAYSKAVKSRLAPYHFTHSLQLKMNPRQQTKWTNWLEYLNYEQWWLELLTADAERREEHYHQALRTLLKVPRCSSREAIGLNRTNAIGGSAASRQIRQPSARELEATRAALDAANKMIDDFAQETARYRGVHAAVFYQRHRVQWAVKEARLMETEISQQRKAAKSNTKAYTNENKKRRCGDNNDDHYDKAKDIPLKPRSKRTKRESEPRRSARLAKLKAN